VNGAWRRQLQTLLDTNGFPFTFVGRQASTAIVGFTKRQHEGYCGAVIAPPGIFPAHQYSASLNYLQKVVPDALTNAIPDVLLILIGANDIGNARNPLLVATNHMATLLDQIFSSAPNVHVILAKITRQDNYGSPANAANIPIYNAALQALVKQRRALGQKVYLADLYSVVPYALFPDGLHPNSTGLALMAQEWLTRIQSITSRPDLFTTVFIDAGATWKYNDSGQDLGTNWTQPNYNDSAWSNGVARLGYGDSVAATTVSFGPQATNKYITTYFRRSFVVPEADVGTFTNLNLRIAQSDGAVVWLNGQEIYRTNLPAGPITYTNKAQSTISYFPRYVFTATNLPMNLSPGTNWIAAEVHLAAPTSSVMGFDLELIGIGRPPIIGSFQLFTPTNANEGDGVLIGQGNVIVSPAPTNDLTINLTSSDTSEATVPASVMILAGQTNATFDVTIIDDSVLDGNQLTFITASAPSYAGAQTILTVHDNDTATLLVRLPTNAVESAGVLAGGGSVSIGSAVAANFTVSLSSSDTSKLIVPATTVISAGNTSATFNVTLVDNTIVEGTKSAGVTAHVATWTDGFASMNILDDDPMPDHFGWSVVPSPQIIGEPFPVTVTARDAANQLVDYRLSVMLSALAAHNAPVGSNTLLNSPSPQQSLTEAVEYVLGYSFTPSANLKVTHVRHYFGDKVLIWTADGRLLASQNVASVPGTWLETALPAPLVLPAGGTYVVTAHENGTEYFWSENLPAAFADGTINQSAWDYGEVFPARADAVQWYFVDLKYDTNVDSVPVTPVATGNFTNGVWSGYIAVLQAATNVILQASAGLGHSGASAPFTVLGTPKLAIASSSNSVVLSWPAAASSFHLEEAVTLSGWNTSSVTPTIVGDRYNVTNALDSNARFYRLRAP
jgi:hypothetical protein